MTQRGEAHDQHFVVQCAIDAYELATEGEGASRRVAEQEAAARALASLPKLYSGKGSKR
jgi:ribonuclease-3